jgi:hypothetical protein
MKDKIRRGIDTLDKYILQKKFASLGLLILTLVALVVVPGVSANPDYFTALQSVYGPTTICLTCHTSTDGPPPFTDYGTLFSNNASHVTDPKGVLEAIGSPLTPTPTPEATPTPTPEVTPTPTPTTMEPQLVLTLTPGAKAANFSSAVLLDNTTTIVESASSISGDGLTATFNLSGIMPGFYSIEVNNLTDDHVPTYIDDNTINQTQFVTGTLTSSIIVDASNLTKYRIKARSGGRHPVVNFATGQNESKLPFIIVYNTSVQKIEIRVVNTSELLTSFTPTNTSNSIHAGLGGTSFQDWQFGSNNHGIVYNNTDSSCNGCHVNMNTKPANYTDVAISNGWCFKCHNGGTNGGDSNGFVDPIQPIEDIIAPVTTISGVTENGSFNNSVTVTLNATDNPGGSGVNETFYMVNGGSTTTYSAPFVVDSVGPDNVTYWSTDKAGNVEPQNMVNFTIVSGPDTTPPVTMISGVTENGSFNNSVNVTLNATDNPGGSGVNETFYMVNGGSTVTYSGPFVVDIVGQDNVTFWSTDKAVNVEPQNMVNFTIVIISPVNATREIKNKSILPGESTNITVSISANANALALHEIPPEGWIVTRGTDNADAFKNSTNEWAWINTDTDKTVTYTLTAPRNISIGTYQINGTIMDANGILTNVEGDNTVKIDILEFYRRLGNDPGVVETTDILKAFDDFRNNIVPQGFDRPLSAGEVDELINEWTNS